MQKTVDYWFIEIIAHSLQNRIKSRARSSRLDLFYEKAVVKGFAKETSAWAWIFFFDEVVGCRPISLFKRDPVMVFSCEFYESFMEHLWRPGSNKMIFLVNKYMFKVRNRITFLMYIYSEYILTKFGHYFHWKIKTLESEYLTWIWWFLFMNLNK